MGNEHFDRATRMILEALQADSRLSNQALAEKVGLSATPVWRRIKELEDSGVIRRHVALADREKLGLSICVLANVSLVRHSEGAVEAFEAMVAGSPEIIECQAITGEADYVVKVVAPDMKAYDQFLQSKVFKVAGVASVRSNVVLREVKYETALPVP
ncbi:MAG: Lrp/AsnC family transcriptional regulator [Roseateles asaccharophilus]|jgi:DNA-binding Lrp family transcriptional regulator|uniref:AsnC family transcriptional regulator n=1 Tax=Roseateles asaccharophilus TaxID=582607 RepID=A0A4R6N340_9BURK|nr:Lrp/AsnC family transcriptional regulator [Roseateles asaccharophilus]MDN3544152.1 Lrp/AsnC family transcriptional regulator [Roseateles asaccharophilus]TDP09254.1 AsnC family transcriptional regulator [Roseateles asaccharophilus]